MTDPCGPTARRLQAERRMSRARRCPVRVPPSLMTSIGICVVVVVALGVYPQAFAHLGDIARLGH